MRSRDAISYFNHTMLRPDFLSTEVTTCLEVGTALKRSPVAKPPIRKSFGVNIAGLFSFAPRVHRQEFAEGCIGPPEEARIFLCQFVSRSSRESLRESSCWEICWLPKKR
jgi:hypothetical protein